MIPTQHSITLGRQGERKKTKLNYLNPTSKYIMEDKGRNNTMISTQYLDTSWEIRADERK